MRRAFLFALLVLALVGSPTASAMLIDRGGGMLYDNQLHVTWLRDANLARTLGASGDGKMSWNAARAWVADLVVEDPLRQARYDDWRLPRMQPGAGDGFGSYDFSNNGSEAFGYGATGGGWGLPGDVDGRWSELGWMYYANLGNRGFCTPNDAAPAGCEQQPGWGLSERGPVANLQADLYWTETAFDPVEGFAWFLHMGWGFQYPHHAFVGAYVWPVRDGDVGDPAQRADAALPEPSVLALLAVALLALGRASNRR